MGLTWDRESFDLGCIKIDRALLHSHETGKTYLGETKTQDTRYLRIPDETMDLLQQWKQEQFTNHLRHGNLWHETGLVFTRDDGQAMNPDSLTSWPHKFSVRHKLPPVNPHAFRHTVASVLIANSTDDVTVSKQLGHASTATTEKLYAHIIQEQQALASECIADVLLRNKQPKTKGMKKA